jgi:mannose-1-phosphate guanylyltransferase/phosphomannomutase
VTRFEVRNTSAPGGFHVKISDRDPERIQIMFFESNGTLASDSTRKDVEKNYNRQELRRALLNQLGELTYPPRVNEAYVSELLSNVDVERIRAARFRMALDYAYSSAALVMPSLLRSLRVESFSTHSFMDPDEQAILAADLPAFTTQTRRLVEAMGANLGVVFDRSAERIVLIDELAREIPPDTALYLLVGLVAKHFPGERIVLPANVSRAAEEIAAEHGVAVVYSGITQAGLIETAAREGVVFAGTPDGGFVFRGVQPGFDAAMSLAKALELLALEQRPLSELCENVPSTSLIHQRAPVPWSLKGLAMRELSERVKDIRVEHADGIRVEENGGWAQLVPDPDEPLFHIYAEGGDGDESAALAQRYRALLEDVLRSAER